MTTTGPRSSRRVALVVSALALAAFSAACGDDAGRPPSSVSPAHGGDTDEVGEAGEPLPDAVQSLEVVGTEYAFEIEGASGPLHPGWTEVTFTNAGDEAHQVMFAYLPDDVDLAELGAMAGDDPSGSAAIGFVDMIGGVSYIGPGQTIQALVDLPAGVVMAMCYVPDPDGTAHAMSGMTAMLTVDADGSDDESGADESGADEPGTDEPETDQPDADDRPTVVGTITMGADGYELPDRMPVGWYRVVNADGGEQRGEGLHELSILQLGEPLDSDGLDGLLDDLASNAAPDVDLVALGGMGALSSGLEGYLYLDLDPGDYIAVDFMPDPGDPRPHLLDGYATLFEL